MRWGKAQDDISPALENVIGNMELPVHTLEESAFVHVDLGDLESRHLAPRFCRIIAVLKVFGGENEGGEKHTPSAL